MEFGKVTFWHIPEWREEVGQVSSWGKSILVRGKGKFKALRQEHALPIQVTGEMQKVDEIYISTKLTHFGILPSSVPDVYKHQYRKLYFYQKQYTDPSSLAV